ncbi:carbohydrate esterase family 16 protein, partial [Piromyces sp. E2]
IKRDPYDFVHQYEKFRNTKGKTFNKEWSSKSSLFGIWIGSNDIRSACGNNTVPTDLYDKSISKMSLILEDLYNNGARNYLILNIPPLEKIPYLIRHPYDYIINDVTYYNNQLNKAIQTFYQNHDDINVFMYDIHNRFNDIISNCAKYKFKECKRSWIRTRRFSLNKYFWSDVSHVSYTATKYFVNDIINLLQSINSKK